jgi:putative tryptophan/tyrosine transport system substrate-binding protein
MPAHPGRIAFGRPGAITGFDAPRHHGGIGPDPGHCGGTANHSMIGGAGSGGWMRRRTFLLGCAAASYPRETRAQARSVPARLGFLGLGSPSVAESRLRSLRQGLGELGLRDGRDYVIEARVAGAAADALDRAAAELVAASPDVLVTHATGTAAVKRATATIPIVMVSGDAVTAGLIESLQRPGGNVTGVSFLSPELMAKRMELLKEISPALEEAGLLALGGYRVTETVVQSVEAVARSLGMKLQPALVRNPAEIDAAFSDLSARGVRGMVVQDEPMLIAKRRAHRRGRGGPAHPRRGLSLELATQGGHLAYSISFDAVWQRVASFVVRILQGARPGDLPVEQPTRFELVVNLKALRALGVDAPPSILARADEVIE